MNGENSWDITICSLLSVILMSALDCSSADIIPSQGYPTHEHMRFKHIRLEVEGNGEARFENLTAIVTIVYGKGSRPVLLCGYLTEISSSHMILTLSLWLEIEQMWTASSVLRPNLEIPFLSAIDLLLIHCLRNGLVKNA